MKVIIGLGNVGKQYEHTRHNAGFLALEYLRQKWQFPLWQGEKKFKGSLSAGQAAGQKVFLFQPHTMMNLSGEAVSLFLNFYKLETKDILVLHDDLDIAAGQLRFTASSRAAGHNGVQDLIERLGTQDFARIRIGIGRPTEVLGTCQPSHDYVLDAFSADEEKTLQGIFPELETLVTEKLSA